MTNISNEFSSNNLLNGSEIQYYQNINNINNINSINNNSSSQDYRAIAYPKKNIDNYDQKSSASNLIRPELEFLKIEKIKLKNIKEIITTKFDKSFKELNSSIKNKKLLLTIDILKTIEDIRLKLFEEINDLEILNKDYDKKFKNILNHKVTQRNHSNIKNINNTNTSSLSNSNNRNSFTENILQASPINNANKKKYFSPFIHINKTPNLNDIKRKPKMPYMNRSKSGRKILNKSINNKSYSEIKINTLSINKSSSNIQDYIKNKSNLNTSIILGNNHTKIDENLYGTNIINSYKIKIEEKEKELNYIKEKLEEEKKLNKNLLNELNQNKYKKSVQKTKDKFNQIINKNNNNTKNDELIILTKKLNQLIEMVINFSYSMATLRSILFSKENQKKNESIQSYETLNNNLKQIYNEFESMYKNLKNEIKNNESKNNNHRLNNSRDNKTKIKKGKKEIIINNINFSLINKEKKNNRIIEQNQNTQNLKVYSSSNNKYKEININSPIKEENSLDITNEEKITIDEIKKNLNDDINIMNQNENSDLNNIHLNIIQNKNRHKIDDNYEIDFEKSKRASGNYLMFTNSEKIFTFRNNSLASNKENDKLTEKSGGGMEAGKVLPIDINKIMEENQILKMQLASEKLKNNGKLNEEKSESHNDEEYEEIISDLKKKLEEKENKINELQKEADSDALNENSFKYKSTDRMNNSINEMEKIKGNYKENIGAIQDLYENMLNEKESKIKELTNEVSIIENELEELNDKYDKEKEKTKLNIIKINELENEKVSLLEQISVFNDKEKELKLKYEKNIEILKNENDKMRSELNNKNIDSNININDCISNYQNDNINDNNYNSASNRQINKQKEELILLKKKYKEILDDNNKLTKEVNDYNLNQVKEKEEFITMMRNTFTKFLKASKIDNKNKDYAIIVLKLLGYNESDIKDIFKLQKKGMIFGIFQ